MREREAERGRQKTIDVSRSGAKDNGASCSSLIGQGVGPPGIGRKRPLGGRP
jgi:hypothetical protein